MTFCTAKNRANSPRNWETNGRNVEKLSAYEVFRQPRRTPRDCAVRRKGALATQALVFTLDGVPMFYNGMEAGDVTESGAPALFENCRFSGNSPNADRNFRVLQSDD
jgi:hypothetical protein